MVKTIGRTINVNDIATLSQGITLNSSTSTKVADSNTDRINFTFSNPGNNQVWLKFQAASVDDDKKGIAILRGGFYEMPTDNIYTGEVSAIAETGVPTVYNTEF